MSLFTTPMDEPNDPERIIIYGEPGGGKSMLAAAARKPLVICAEQPGNEVKRAIRASGGRYLDQPTSWEVARVEREVARAGRTVGP